MIVSIVLFLVNQSIHLGKKKNQRKKAVFPKDNEHDGTIYLDKG